MRPSSRTPPPPTEAPADLGDEVGAAEMTRRVAENLRRLRKERGLSFDQLASVSGVSRAALSQIEGAKTNPTLAVLWKIAVGLSVPFQALLGVEGGSKARVLRVNDALPLRSPDGRIESRLLSPAGATPGLEVYELRFHPRGTLRSDPHSAGTSETVVVLTGALRVSVADERYDLVAGDSIFFSADVPHQYENRGSREARVLDVITYGRGVG
ncbi:MAG TPA: XRE family transcriptional regulator [Polyangiaceae bacterium]|nr:XRE family transcriptional regulator [Polyangiaceae bacterium]